METTTAMDISRLVSDLENLAAASNSNNSSRQQHLESSLPSLQQLYRLGLVLFRILQQTKQNRKSIDSDSVVTAYRDLIESIPDENLQRLFADLRKASQRLLANSSSNSSAAARDLSLAVHSMEGLVVAFSDADSQTCNSSTESNSRLCRVIYDSAWISTLSAFYDRFIVLEKQQQQQQKNSQQQQRKGNHDRMTKTEMESTKRAILSCLSRLVLDGLVLGGNATVEESLLEAIRSMEEESTDCLRDLQDWQTMEEPFRRNLKDSLEAIEGNSNSMADEDEILERAQQREYIISMLESARGEPSSMAIPAFQETESKQSRAPAKKTMPVAMSSAADTELDRRIQQVLQILPHFGQGFVEVALGLHQGDVEATVSTLLHHPSNGSPPSSDYPTALRVLDPKLPRRKREFQAYQTAQEEAHSAEEARNDVKKRMALEEKQRQDQYEALMVVSASQQQQQQQQQEATTESEETPFAPPLPRKKLTRKELRQQKLRQLRKRDEYDDDYDDQYDEIEIKLGAADDGFTSDNMTFEQVKLYNQVVQEDESDAAFWESNRNTNQKGRNSDGSEKKWGPDKIKGGRVIGADGKIVRKPGGVKKKKTNNSNNNRNNNNANNTSKSNNNNSNGLGGKPKANNNSNNNTGNNAANNSNKKKPKTKPRSDNRVNRQRDRKLKKQGAFGVQD